MIRRAFRQAVTLLPRSGRGTPSMPGHVGRVLVRLLVNVGGCRDANDHEEHDARCNRPTAVHVRRNVAVNMLHEGPRRCVAMAVEYSRPSRRNQPVGPIVS